MRRAFRVGCAVLLLAAGGVSAQPSPPIVTDPAWFTWYQNLLSQRLAECPRERAQTFYFSQSGSDTAGDGTQANPWKTLAKANQVLLAAAPVGNIAVLFKRGDIWRETVGIEISTPNITIADYGVGEKPLFTVFQPVGDPSGWSPTVGAPNVYQRSASARVMWAKQDDDLDRPWSRQKTITGVTATEGSWYWSSGVLYVHPRHGSNGMATDPRTDGNAYEYVNETGAGVRVKGDGSRVENIRAQGWGITVQPGSHVHGVESRVEGADRAVIVGCESHYGLSHVLTHLSVMGGVATFVDCKAGLCTYSALGGETMFNTYSYLGGQQTIFDHCEATHGTLPSDDFDPAFRKGTAFYGHTSNVAGSLLDLTISNACTVRDTKWGCTNGTGFDNVTPSADLAHVKCFVVGERMEVGSGTGESWRLGMEYTARVNGRYFLHPGFTGLTTMNNFARGWVINCTMVLDFTDQPGDYSIFRSDQFAPSTVQVWDCYLGINTRPGQTIRFDGATPPNSEGSNIENSIIIATGGGVCTPNLAIPVPIRRARTRPATALEGNVYFGVNPLEVQLDPRAVVLNEPLGPATLPSCNAPLACGQTVFPGGAIIGYDQRGIVGVRNDIGPLEAFWCANCDGSTAPPALNILDFQCFLNKYALQDPAANCDGSTTPPTLNILDFVCFQAAFARGCK